MPSSPLPLAELVSALALDAVRTQRALDAAWAGPGGELARWSEDFLAVLPADAATRPEVVALLAPLGPVRTRVSAWEAACSVAVSARRETSAALAVQPLGLLWERRYGTASAQTSRLRLRVEPAEFPTGQAVASAAPASG